MLHYVMDHLSPKLAIKAKGCINKRTHNTHTGMSVSAYLSRRDSKIKGERKIGVKEFKRDRDT